MSTKIEQVSAMEHAIQTAVSVSAPASSTVSPKVSMFAKKSGFVIPKNKLSGSLVPIFRGSKKAGGTDVESEENTKQALRKTKWGPDLTQDASVRKGRTLAYQTRVDQITRQLKSGIREAKDDQDSPVSHGAAQESVDPQELERSELLELERREVIGEILKLNPSYKAPADYKPLLKEAKVPIPIKEYPGHNFIGLIFGPANDTQKRLEKETGAKIRVYGIGADTKKEIELTSSDGNETGVGYEELYVLVTADTYEKVDSAVSLIELVVTPVSANTVAVSTTVTVSGDNQDGVSLGQDTPPSYTASPVAQSFTGSGPAPRSGQFPPYPNHWVPAGQPSRFIAPPFPNSSAPMLPNSMQPVNSSVMPSSFGQPPGFGSVVRNPSLGSSQPHSILQRPNLGYTGPPRNPSFPSGQPSFSAPNPPTPTGMNQNVPQMSPLTPQSGPNYTFPDRPLTTTGWTQSPGGSPGTLGPTHMPHMMRPMVCPQAPIPMSGGQPSQFRPSGAPSPLSSSSQYPASVAPTSSIPPPPIKPPSVTALRPQQPSSNDFTFQTNRAQTPFSQQLPRPRSLPGPQFMPLQNPPVHPPQSPSFRPGMAIHGPPPVMQGFSRPHNNHQMGQPRQPMFPGPEPRLAATHAPHMGPGRFGPPPPSRPSPGPGNFGQLQQNYPSMGFKTQNFMAPMNPQFHGNPGRPVSNPSGLQQIYDPFSPTAAVPPKSQLGGNPQTSRKQDTDPEYDDLMASVGVK